MGRRKSLLGKVWSSKVARGFKPEPVRKPSVPKRPKVTGGLYLYGNKSEGANAAAKQKERHDKVREKIAEEREFRVWHKKKAVKARKSILAKKAAGRKKVLKKAWHTIW